MSVAAVSSEQRTASLALEREFVGSAGLQPPAGGEQGITGRERVARRTGIVDKKQFCGRLHRVTAGVSL